MDLGLNVTERKKHYPFISRYFSTSDGYRLHYIDEGEGHPLVLFHGNPTWSFYYRNIIKELSRNYRVLALDNANMGGSSRVIGNIKLADKIRHAKEWFQYLRLSRFCMGVHDWGGPIGLGSVMDQPEKLNGLYLFNTAAFISSKIPWRIDILRKHKIGSFLMRECNAFLGPAMYMASEKKLPRDIKSLYLRPYKKSRMRQGIVDFVKDIPMDENHPSFRTMSNIESSLGNLNCPVEIHWGMKDFCFNPYFLDEWKKRLPGAVVFEYPEAGHFVLEDAIGEILPRIKESMRNWRKLV